MERVRTTEAAEHIGQAVRLQGWLHQFRELASTEDEQTTALFAPLTSREIEILDCIARGLSNKEIANELSISGQTVKNHITSILAKLQVNDRTMAVIYAIQRGWIKMGGTTTMCPQASRESTTTAKWWPVSGAQMERSSYRNLL